eukprot:jgi/Chlat1/707/Chrsp104S01196
MSGMCTSAAVNCWVPHVSKSVGLSVKHCGSNPTTSYTSHTIAPNNPIRKTRHSPPCRHHTNRRAYNPITSSSSSSSSPLSLSVLWRQTVATFASGAVLGPLLDGEHSRHDVLHYTSPAHITLGPFYELESVWWVPLLFGVAGAILGVAHPLLDRWVLGPDERDGVGTGWDRGARMGLEPRWPVVLAGIALFAAQYSLSGVLAQAAALPSSSPVPVARACVDLTLGAYAVATWWLLDRTRGGLFMATLTAFAGPVIEIVLINYGGLYAYTHADVLGVPTWIPWVYFCGSPAVGNLGRRTYATLVMRSDKRAGTLRN